MAKTLRALQATGHQRVVVAGGVGANRLLRAQLRKAMAAQGASVYYPRIEFCTDNGAMVALTGSLRLRHGARPSKLVEARPLAQVGLAD